MNVRPAPRRRPRRCLNRRLASALLVAAAAAFLAGGTGTKPSPSGVGASVETRLQSTQPAPLGKDPFVVRIAIGSEPTVLDPHDASDAPSALVNFHLYDRLVELDDQMNPRPSLAQAWQVSADGLTWKLTLRTDVTFHDGTPFDAEAVVVNLQRLADPQAALARRNLLGEYIETVRATGRYEVEVKLLRPVASFLRLLAHEAHSMISPAALAAHRRGEPFQPIGTGPFLLEEWIPGTRLVLAANQAHWRGAPAVDRLILLTTPDGSQRVIMLETGAADLIYPVDPVHYPRLRAAPGIEAVALPSQRMIYLALNLTRPPFDDLRERRAAAAAVDRAAIAGHLLRGLATAADAPLAPQTWGYTPLGKEGFRYDPVRAAAILEEVYRGQPPPLTLWGPSNRYPQDKLVAQAVAAYLESVGFTVQIRLFEWGTYLALLRRSSDWDLALLGWVPATGDADMALRPLFAVGARANHGGYASPAVDRLLKAAAEEIDRDRRLALYREAQAQLVADAPVIWLYSLHTALAHRAHIGGVRLLPNELLDARGLHRVKGGR